MSLKNLPIRIQNKIFLHAVTGCWVWIGAVNEKGYGRVMWNKKNSRAHRVIYEISVRKIRKGYELDHICNNKTCVNPFHLEQVTPRVNRDRQTIWLRKLRQS